MHPLTRKSRLRGRSHTALCREERVNDVPTPFVTIIYGSLKKKGRGWAGTGSSAEWISSRKTNLPCFPLCGWHLSDKSCIAGETRGAFFSLVYNLPLHLQQWRKRDVEIRGGWRGAGFDRGSPSTSSTKGPRGAIFLPLLFFFKHRPRDTRAAILTQVTISGDSRKFVKGCRSARRVNHSRELP